LANSRRKWRTGEIARVANERGVDASSLVSPADVAAIVTLADSGELTDRLARQVLDDVINGEGSPTDGISARGQGPGCGCRHWCSCEGMRGTADAARVRELVLEGAGQVVTRGPNKS
jgi:hypothetical protein